MGQGSGIREVAWVDIAGGGQVVLDGNYAYVGHMQPPHGTSVVDVTDPANPKVVASIDIPAGLHSHKVRVANDIMVTNRVPGLFAIPDPFLCKAWCWPVSTPSGLV